MRDRTLVTGFLAFGRFPVNPSALLAESSGRPFELLEVSFAAVDEFVDRVVTRRHAFDRLLMLGVRGGGTAIDLEQLARNHVGADPDVRGDLRGPGGIEAGAPEILTGTLFDTPLPSGVSLSDDAGCYLCNYLYYRALRHLPGKQVGFVHVPPPDIVPLQTQRALVERLLAHAERPAAPSPA